VVDPKLDGKVKVTVIATGFEPVASRQPVASGTQTPVDLQHYSAQLKDRAEAPPMELGRLSIGRRLALDLAAVVPPPSQTDLGDIDLDALSAFDVPAFLRREG
jgi:hypothetical protein